MPNYFNTRYDFSDLLEACANCIATPNKNSVYLSLRKELNKFFKDSACIDIIYTKNDSVFFGMCVYPIIDKEMVKMILQDDEKIRFKQYVIEIDSKLFNPVIDIQPEEFLAVLLHEVGHIINDPNPVEQARDAINISLAKTNTSLNIINSVQFYQILAYGIKNTIRKLNSMFFIYKDSEVLADEFVEMCGYGKDLEDVHKKLVKNGMKVNDDVDKLAALTWTLNVYRNINTRRIPAMNVLRRVYSICPSRLEKKELEIATNALKSIDVSNINEEAMYDDLYVVFTEDSSSTSLKKKETKYAMFKREVSRNHLRDFEQDAYEYTLRIRHISTEEDALYLMRQINLRIVAIEDALNKVRFSESDKKRWYALLDKYYALREQMANNTKYRYDYSNSVITVQYPDIVENRF